MTRVIRSDQHQVDLEDPNNDEKKQMEESSEHIVFKVNTPTFYTRFFHYDSPFAAIQNEMLDNERTRTVWSSHPQELAALFPQDTKNTCREPLDWRWRIISSIRTAPNKTNYPRYKSYEPCRGTSLTDILVKEQCSMIEFRDYRRALIRHFLGHWIGGFSIGPVRQGDFELIGLSRDAVLKIYEAFLKLGFVMSTIFFVRKASSEPANVAYSLFAIFSMSSLNLWACLKCML